MKRWLLALWLVPLVGCADSGPAGPTTVSRDLSAPATSFGFVAGTSLSFVSGETGHPVPGARVVIAGRDFISDGAGRVLLSELAPNGATVDIEANGFLDRKTLVRRGEVTTFELWPSESPTQQRSTGARLTSVTKHQHGGVSASLIRIQHSEFKRSRFPPAPARSSRPKRARYPGRHSRAG